MKGVIFMEITNKESFSKELGVLMFKSVFKDDDELVDTAQAMLNCIDKVDQNTLRGIEEEVENYAVTSGQKELYIETIEDTFDIKFDRLNGRSA